MWTAETVPVDRPQLVPKTDPPQPRLPSNPSNIIPNRLPSQGPSQGWSSSPPQGWSSNPPQGWSSSPPQRWSSNPLQGRSSSPRTSTPKSRGDLGRGRRSSSSKIKGTLSIPRLGPFEAALLVGLIYFLFIL